MVKKRRWPWLSIEDLHIMVVLIDTVTQNKWAPKGSVPITPGHLDNLGL
jgi:hypothetical protein